MICLMKVDNEYANSAQLPCITIAKNQQECGREGAIQLKTLFLWSYMEDDTLVKIILLMFCYLLDETVFLFFLNTGLNIVYLLSNLTNFKFARYVILEFVAIVLFVFMQIGLSICYIFIFSYGHIILSMFNLNALFNLVSGTELIML